MSFTIDGVNLQNTERGWSVRAGTRALAARSWERPSLAGAGRDGVVPGLRAAERPQARTLIVKAPRDDVDTLALLVSRGRQLRRFDNPGRVADIEVLSFSPAGRGDAEAVVDVTIVYRIPALHFRDETDGTWSTPLNAATVAVDVMAGLTGAVHDAAVRIRGGVTAPRVQDSAGSWMAWPGVLPASQWLRFELTSGRAFLTGTDTWTGGTEVTDDVTNGPGPYPLELTPLITNPATLASAARLTVTTTARTGSPTIEVRGRRAYGD